MTLLACWKYLMILYSPKYICNNLVVQATPWGSWFITLLWVSIMLWSFISFHLNHPWIQCSFRHTSWCVYSEWRPLWCLEKFDEIQKYILSYFIKLFHVLELMKKNHVFYLPHEPWTEMCVCMYGGWFFWWGWGVSYWLLKTHHCLEKLKKMSYLQKLRICLWDWYFAKLK